MTSAVSLARMEEAEGILKPQESEKLNFNPQCIQSPLMSRLWAAAVLCWNSGQCLILPENRDWFCPY